VVFQKAISFRFFLEDAMSDVVMSDSIEFAAPFELDLGDYAAHTHSPEQIKMIERSLVEFGQVRPLMVDEAGRVIAGRGVLIAARNLRLNRVSFVSVAGLSSEQLRLYAIADNKIAEASGWDEELLRLELGELRELGLDLTVAGFDEDELKTIFLGPDGLEEDGLTDPDAVPEGGEGYVTNTGDVWICGPHRVMCGDATVLDDLETLTAGVAVEMCWTDPPYNVNYEGTAGKIQNDNMEADAFAEFLRDAFVSVFAVLEVGGAIYVAHADTEGLAFRNAFAGAGLKLSGCLVWVKPSLVLGRSDYQWRHEPILYGWKPGAAHRWYGGRANTTVHEFEAPPFVIAPDGSVHIDAGSGTLRISGTDLMVEELVGSVVRHEKPARNTEHPTMKPVGLIMDFLKNSSQRGDIVLDPFAGSGSTLIAAQKIGRNGRMLELDPRFVDVIVRRWQDFTGQTAVLERSGETFAELSAKRAA
jgi:DNA modification methylase